MRKVDRPVALSPLGGVVDTLLQAFEDRRAGLRDDVPTSVEAEAYFLKTYEGESERLRDALALAEPQLSSRRREALAADVDALVRRVLVPAYARVAAGFTARERNDFFLLRGAGRYVERAGWLAGGLLVGALVIAAPFVPLWSKEWILGFGLVGLAFPELRRYVGMRRYQRELDTLSARSAREIERLRDAVLLGDAKSGLGLEPMEES